jgi:hypothetical protein
MRKRQAMFEDDLDDDVGGIDDEEEPENRAYAAVLRNKSWASTRKLAIEGTIFRHSKHPAEVHPGVQHKLFVWICETKRPATHCPCGLYAVQWIE